MAKTISTTKANPIRPFYAAVGGVDIAVALARTGLSDVQTRLAKVEREPKALVGQVQAEAQGPSRPASRRASTSSSPSSTTPSTTSTSSTSTSRCAARTWSAGSVASRPPRT